MKKAVFLTIAALFMFGCTKTSECYVEKAETLTEVKSGCRSLTEISEIAQKAAMNFMADGTKSNKVVKIASIIPYNEALTKSSEEPLCYVVGYENRGFSIIGAKKNMPEVLVYSENGDYDVLSSSSEGFKMYMGDMISQLARIDDSDMPDILYTKIDSTRTNSFNYPLVSVLWHQHEPFNWYCNGYPAGCVAIAMGQAMSVFDYPKSINLTFPSAPSSSVSLNWNEIKNSIHSSEHSMSCEYCNQTALFIREIGQRVQMSYSMVESSADIIRFGQSAFSSFGFTCSSDFAYNLNLILKDLENKRPVLIGGFPSDPNKSGHIWVTDGSKYTKLEKRYYDVSSKTGIKKLNHTENIEDWYLHFNYGYGEETCGYYLTQRIKSGEGSLYIDGTYRETVVSIFSAPAPNHTAYNNNVVIFKNIHPQ